jgi:hypothetical protein
VLCFSVVWAKALSKSLLYYSRNTAYNVISIVLLWVQVLILVFQQDYQA